MIQQFKKLLLLCLLAWSFTAPQVMAQAFITEWITTDGTITIPTFTGTPTEIYNYNVSYRELPAGATTVLTGQTGDVTISGLNGNTYEVSITGQFPRIYFNSGPESSKILNIKQWGAIAWSSMASAFKGCSNLGYTATDAPDLSSVTDMSDMFSFCSVFNGNIGNWNTQNIRNMSSMFFLANNFNQNIGTWNTGNVRNMSSMFRNTDTFDQNISTWDTGNVTDMSLMFAYAIAFNQPIGTWNTVKVINMNAMFQSATAFNQPIGTWNTRNVTNMSSMFYLAGVFNQNIGTWNTQSVTDMGNMFNQASVFNQNIGTWNTGNVTNMSQMFFIAPAFNQPIGTWNTINVTDMSLMFLVTSSFNQNIGNWNVTNVTNMSSMLDDCGMNTANYDATLIGWAAQNVRTGVALGAGRRTYCAGEAARDNLITNKGWVISDDALLCVPFITEWIPNGGNITIPTTGTGYNYTVSYRRLPAGGVTVLTGRTGNVTLTGLTNGATYEISITGAFPRIYFNFGSESSKIRNIKQWGNIGWTSMGSAFMGCRNLTYTATDAPDLSNVTDLSYMFMGCSIFNGNIGTWNTQNVTNMSSMFQEATDFNQPIGTWNTQNVTMMSEMFQRATAFNQNIGTWNTTNVTNMSSMFLRASTFNQNISTWNTTKVTNMSTMFFRASDFNQNISTWNTTNVIDMSGMFGGATVFNQNISTWNTTKVTNMSNMFNGTTVFNQNISTWDTQNVTDMSGMFQEATAFNQNIDNWNTVKVTNMAYMFQNATAFNQPIGTWNTQNVTDMSDMFNQASVFNQNIGTWNTGKVTNMSNMFAQASVFNQNIGTWDTGKVSNMYNMFFNAISFNQSLANWNVTDVTNMVQTFFNATAFNQSLASWNVTNVTNMVQMLDYCGMNTANYDATLIGWAAQNVQTGVNLGATGRAYSSAACAARSTLVNSKSWVITGDIGGECISVSTTALTAFASCAGTVSTEQNYTVSGSNLTANISIVPPTDFEISTSTGGAFVATNPIILTQTGGNVATTTIYVRQISTAINGASGNITHTSTGAAQNKAIPISVVNSVSITGISAASVAPTATTFNLVYTGTTGTANQYSIVSVGTATPLTGFVAVNNATLTTSPISVTIPASAANTYTFNLTVRNSITGCVSAIVPFTLQVAVPSPPPPPPAPVRQTITFDSIPDRVFSRDLFELKATASSGLPVSFTVVSGNATLLGTNFLQITGLGEIVVRANQAGNNSFAAAEPITRRFRVTARTQSLSGFATITDRPWNSESFVLSVTSSLGLPVTFTVTEGANIAEIINGNIVRLRAAIGRVTISASQAGDGVNSPAPTLTQSFNVTKADQSITSIAGLPTLTFGSNLTQRLAATASSGLAVGFAVASGNASIVGDQITFTSAGNVVVNYTQTGNDLWNAATLQTRTFTVGKANQEILVTVAPQSIEVGSSATLSASVASGLPVTMRVAEGLGTVNGLRLTPTGGASITVEFNQAGNDNYNAAPAVLRTIILTPTLSLGTITGSRFCGGSIVRIDYTVAGLFSGSNIFAVYLSDANGNFTNSRLLVGTFNGQTSGTIVGNIPASVPAGTGYRLRIEGLAPAIISASSSQTIEINPLPVQASIVQNGAELIASVATGVQWFANGTAISGATNQRYTPTEAQATDVNTLYTVVVTGNGGCTSVSNPVRYQKIPVVTGIDDATLSAKLSVYPNPTTDKFIVELGLPKAGKVTLRMVDAMGREVYTETVTSATANLKHEVQTTNMASGVYVLMLNVDEKVAVKRIVKQ